MSEERSPGHAGTLEEMAGAVADRTPVQWGAEQARVPELSRAIDRLKEIEALHAAHLRFLREDPLEAGMQPLMPSRHLGGRVGLCDGHHLGAHEWKEAWPA